ncbi:MAG TPA: aldehyde dehydrogenase family protein, partial [Mycobacterium sp.]
MTTDSIPQTTPAVPAPVAPDVPGTVARLRETFLSGRTRSIEWRKQQLRALEKLMAENEPAIAEALATDLGRKPFEAWLADIVSTGNEARDAAKHVGKWARRKHRMLEFSQLPGRGWVEYEPYGTVLVIG